MGGNELTRVMQRLRRAVGGTVEGLGDVELLRRYSAAREEQAFTALVERHGAMVRGVCRRVLGQDADADDAFQATFLVLARKAGSIFWHESVAGWLYQTAYRTACKARVATARRRQHELATGTRSESADVRPELRELQRVIDEELSRLPEKFRLPVLLCCLHDLTTDEAANRLGWSFTTVKGRLQRGREKLRHRLKRRGIALSAGVLGTLLAESSVGAAPAALVASTVQAAGGGTTAPAVASLVKGVCSMMFWARMKVVAGALAMVLVLGVGIGWGVIAMAGDEPPAPVAQAPAVAPAAVPTSAAAPAPAEDRKPGTIQGKVRTVTGKPLAGMIVLVFTSERDFSTGKNPCAGAVSGANGHYGVTGLTPSASYYLAVYDFSFDRKMYLLARRTKVGVETGKTTTVEIADVAAAPEVVVPAKAAQSVRDAATGITVRIGADQKSLVAYDANENIVWKVRLVADGSQAVVQNLHLHEGEVGAGCTSDRGQRGEPFYKIELRTGKILHSQINFPKAADAKIAPTAIKDPISGISVRMSADDKSLEAIDGDGKQLWQRTLVHDGRGYVPYKIGIVGDAVEAICIKPGKGTVVFKFDVRSGKMLKAEEKKQ